MINLITIAVTSNSPQLIAQAKKLAAKLRLEYVDLQNAHDDSLLPRGLPWEPIGDGGFQGEAGASLEPPSHELASRRRNANRNKYSAPWGGDIDLWLVLTETHLELRQNHAQTTPIKVDFLSGKLAYYRRTTGRNQLLARAIGVKKLNCPSVIDTTAGLGRDAFILASLGCQVTLLERSPIVAALLQDGIDRLHAAPAYEAITLQLKQIDAIAYLQTLKPANSLLPRGLPREPTGDGDSQGEPSAPLESPSRELASRRRNSNRNKYSAPWGGDIYYPDVIYLDPMFPERMKSALVKKEMRILHRLVGEDVDADQLLAIALKRARKRVVVKRPRLAPTLINVSPSFCVKGESIRYDVYSVSTG